MRSLLALVLAMVLGLTAIGPVWGSTYYIYSQWGGTWQDANKTGVDDGLMCWAASASNILDWGGWTTPAFSTADKIFSDIKYYWTNNRGWQSWAWSWWLNGTQPPNKFYAYVNVKGGGDYFPTVNFDNLFAMSFGSGEIAYMDKLMHQGYGISLVIGTASGASHAITAWGFDYNLLSGKTNYTSLYITDSDDKATALKKMGIAYSAAQGWYFTSGYTNWKINGVYGFERNSLSASANSAAAPIVPTCWLFASGLAVCGGLGLRRTKLLLN
jgi:hypothetical protein